MKYIAAVKAIRVILCTSANDKFYNLFIITVYIIITYKRQKCFFSDENNLITDTENVIVDNNIIKQ